MNTRLPFVPRTQPGEAPLNLLRRAALGNGFRKTLLMANAVNSNVDWSLTALWRLARDPHLFVETCQAIGIDESEASKVCYARIGKTTKDDLLWNGLRVNIEDLHFRKPRICIACYLEQGYALSEWDHIAAFTCTKHKVLLESACPVCGNTWSHNSDPLKCGCDEDQMTANLKFCSDTAASLLSNIITRKDQDNLTLVTAILKMLDYWRNVGIKLSRGKIADILALLSQTRGEFAAVAASLPSANTELHPRCALAPLLTHRSPFVINHAEQLLAANFPAIPTDISNELTWPIQTAAVALGVSRQTLIKLITDGHLTRTEKKGVKIAQINAVLNIVSRQVGSSSSNPVSTLLSQKHGQPLSILIRSIQSGRQATSQEPTHLEDCHEALDIQQAAKLLDTNRDAIRCLIRTGYLEASKGTPKSAVRWMISKQSLTRFRHRYVFAGALARRIGAAVTTLSSKLRSAGIQPVSGPGIDSGITYLFRRSDLATINLEQIASSPYASPAGRKKAPDHDITGKTLSTRDAATQLGISPRLIRTVIREGWLSPIDRMARNLTFYTEVVSRLATKLEKEYCSINKASSALRMSEHEFRRIWIETRFCRIEHFAGKMVVPSSDFQKIELLWRNAGTCKDIAQKIGRKRWICANLKKLDLITPHLILGTGNKKVHLYSRTDPAFKHYEISA